MKAADGVRCASIGYHPPVMSTRRTFLQSAAAAAAAMLLPASRGRAAARAAGDEKLTFCAPLTHSDWMLRPGMQWGGAGVRHMLDACKACGWSHILWRAFDAGQANYASKLVRPGLYADDDNIFNPQTNDDRAAVRKILPNLTAEQAARYLTQFETIKYDQFDSLAAAIDYGHQVGLKIHAWITINEDDHGWGWPSEFTRNNPQFRWKRRDGRAYRSQLSFAFDEVRQYKLGLIDELLAYPIDGIFLDWIRTGDIRDNPQTDSAGVADSGYEAPLVEAFKKAFGLDPHDVPNGDDRWVRVRAQPQTVLMREARKRCRAAKKPLAVLVGHPWHYRGTLDKIDGNLRGLLLDVKTWADEDLADAFIAAGYYRDGGTPEMAYKALRDETGGRKDAWTYAWVPQSVGEFEHDFALAQTLGAKQILFWEADYIDGRPNAGELKSAMSRRAKW